MTCIIKDDTFTARILHRGETVSTINAAAEIIDDLLQMQLDANRYRKQAATTVTGPADAFGDLVSKMFELDHHKRELRNIKNMPMMLRMDAFRQALKDTSLPDLDKVEEWQPHEDWVCHADSIAGVTTYLHPGIPYPVRQYAADVAYFDGVQFGSADAAMQRAERMYLYTGEERVTGTGVDSGAATAVVVDQAAQEPVQIPDCNLAGPSLEGLRASVRLGELTAERFNAEAKRRYEASLLPVPEEPPVMKRQHAINKLYDQINETPALFINNTQKRFYLAILDLLI